MKISLTAILQIAINVFILTASFGTYELMSKRIQDVFIENDRSANQQKVDLIAKSIRQSAPSNNYVAMRAVFQSSLKDSSIKLVRYVPSDGTEGVCVGNERGCYSNATIANPIESTLYYDAAQTQPIGKVVVETSSPQAAKLTAMVKRYMGGALALLILVFNLILFAVFRTIKKQINWSIEAVSSLSVGSTMEAKQSIFVEKEDFSRAFNKLRQVLETYRKSIEVATKRDAFTHMARQVAHDIRSPLSALEVAMTDMQALPEDKRIMIRGAVAGIRDIANTLLDNAEAMVEGHTLGNEAKPPIASNNVNESHSVQLISTLIDTVVSQKRLQYRALYGVDISVEHAAHSYSIFAKIKPIELKRAVANLIDNAIESIDEVGKVTVKLSRTEQDVIIQVCDTGKGIPPDLLSKVAERGVTYGKPKGSGLGLSHAKATAESWGGSLEIASIEGKGTTVALRLTCADAPEWFVTTLQIKPATTVLILDDDSSVHQIWDKRFTDLNASAQNISLLHFSSANELEEWWQENSGTIETLCLFDYELLGQEQTGLDLIEQLEIADRSILVTSRYDEGAIRERCERLGVKRIPKGLAGFVPLEVSAKKLLRQELAL